MITVHSFVVYPLARILITGFCSFPGTNRVGVQLGHIIDGLSREHQVDVLVRRDGAQAHGEKVRGARVLRVSMPKQESEQVEAFQRALRRQLGAVEYDVVQFRDGWSGVAALEMKRKHKFVTVFDVTRSPMALSADSDLATTAELHIAHQSCLRRADLILAPSEEAQQYLAGVTDEPKLHVVPPGVNVDKFDWEYPVEGGRPVLLYLGKVGKGCGIQLLLQAMQKVRSSSDAILLLGGPSTPEFTKTLSQVVEEMGLSDCVRVLGEIPHRRTPAAIALARVCIVPKAVSRNSSPTVLFPTKILEYMACRRPVVAPRGSIVEQILSDEQQGLLFESESATDLSAQILRLLNDTTLCQELSLLGYEKVRRHFSASTTRRKLGAAYRWLSTQSAYGRRMANSEGSDSIVLMGSDLLMRVDEQDTPSLQMDDTHEVSIVSAPTIEGGDVTRVELNPLLRMAAPHRSPERLRDAAGTINVDAIAEVDEDAGTGEIEIDPVPWIDGSALEMIEDDSGVGIVAIKEDTDTETRLERARPTPPPGDSL